MDARTQSRMRVTEHERGAVKYQVLQPAASMEDQRRVSFPYQVFEGPSVQFKKSPADISAKP